MSPQGCPAGSLRFHREQWVPRWDKKGALAQGSAARQPVPTPSEAAEFLINHSTPSPSKAIVEV